MILCAVANAVMVGGENYDGRQCQCTVERHRKGRKGGRAISSHEEVSNVFWEPTFQSCLTVVLADSLQVSG